MAHQPRDVATFKKIASLVDNLRNPPPPPAPKITSLLPIDPKAPKVAPPPAFVPVELKHVVQEILSIRDKDFITADEAVTWIDEALAAVTKSDPVIRDTRPKYKALLRRLLGV